MTSRHWRLSWTHPPTQGSAEKPIHVSVRCETIKRASEAALSRVSKTSKMDTCIRNPEFRYMSAIAGMYRKQWRVSIPRDASACTRRLGGALGVVSGGPETHGVALPRGEALTVVPSAPARWPHSDMEGLACHLVLGSPLQDSCGLSLPRSAS